jgi:hypothetical protein
MESRQSIGDLAKATGTKVVTIRYYEQIGLLPVPSRTATTAPLRRSMCDMIKAPENTPLRSRMHLQSGYRVNVVSTKQCVLALPPWSEL